MRPVFRGECAVTSRGREGGKKAAYLCWGTRKGQRMAQWLVRVHFLCRSHRVVGSLSPFRNPFPPLPPALPLSLQECPRMCMLLAVACALASLAFFPHFDCPPSSPCRPPPSSHLLARQSASLPASAGSPPSKPASSPSTPPASRAPHPHSLPHTLQSGSRCRPTGPRWPSRLAASCCCFVPTNANRCPPPSTLRVVCPVVVNGEAGGRGEGALASEWSTPGGTLCSLGLGSVGNGGRD